MIFFMAKRDNFDHLQRNGYGSNKIEKFYLLFVKNLFEFKLNIICITDSNNQQNLVSYSRIVPNVSCICECLKRKKTT
jgi:hypothetical protein